MKVRWQTEWPLWLVLAAMFGVAAVSWHAVPDRIPVHWGVAGRPDRWGGRFEGLLLPPLIGVGLYLLLPLVRRVDPGRANYASFAGAFETVRLVLLLAMLGIQVVMVLAARGVAPASSALLPLVMGALLTALGNLLGKLRPNWFIGVRTPWTLSSKRSWDRTHRAGGRLFILCGLLLMSAALVRASWYFVAGIAATGAGVVGLVVFSYLVWKRDPDKNPPAGTLAAGE